MDKVIAFPKASKMINWRLIDDAAHVLNEEEMCAAFWEMPRNFNPTEKRCWLFLRVFVRNPELVERLIEDLVQAAFRETNGGKEWKTFKPKLKSMIRREIINQSEELRRQIIQATKINPEQVKLEIKQKRAEARKNLAKELSGARQKLGNIQHKISVANEVAAKMVEDSAREYRKIWAKRLKIARQKLIILKQSSRAESLKWMAREKPFIDEASLGRLYPDVPPPMPMIRPSTSGFGLPDAPGIYFLWLADKVEYVGRALSLNRRLLLGSHHVLTQEHEISFLFFDVKELSWAEAFYIGVLKSPKNFGKLATHYETTEEKRDEK